MLKLCENLVLNSGYEEFNTFGIVLEAEQCQSNAGAYQGNEGLIDLEIIDIVIDISCKLRPSGRVTFYKISLKKD